MDIYVQKESYKYIVPINPAYELIKTLKKSTKISF